MLLCGISLMGVKCVGEDVAYGGGYPSSWGGESGPLWSVSEKLSREAKVVQ